MNRRSFLKTVSFYSGSIVAGLTLNPFGFLQKTAKAETVSSAKKYRWIYCDDVEIKKIGSALRGIRSGQHFNGLDMVPDFDDIIAVTMNHKDVESQMDIRSRYYLCDLMDLGIENVIIQGIPVISLSGAKKMSKLKMLGKRIYAP